MVQIGEGSHHVAQREAEKHVDRRGRGPLQETEDSLRLAQPGRILDALTIACLRRITLYQIAAYDAAQGYATKTGPSRKAELLGHSLNEVMATESALSRIAATEELPQEVEAGFLAH